MDKNRELFYKGSFGLERETLRIDAKKRLSQAPHPFTDKAITRDFCENQTELVTPVCGSVYGAVSELERLDKKARATLKKLGEDFWVYSNPPRFDSESQIPIADFSGEEISKRIYREHLQRRYGKRLMLYCGVHFNFSFCEEYLRSICDRQDFEGFCADFYLRLYKQVFVHSWLLVLLTAASPVYDLSLDGDGKRGAVRSSYASIRNSERGYWNSFVPVLRFGSIGEFVDSIQEYADAGKLHSAWELYLPVRLKPRGENCLENLKKGVSHIELRMFDLDPKQRLGVNEKDLEFAHLLLMYLSQLPDFELTAKMQIQAVKNHKNAALSDLTGIEIDGEGMIKKAAEIIDDMKWFFAGDKQALELIEEQRCKLYHRPCMTVRTKDIYQTDREGGDNVRVARFFRKRAYRYSHTAAGVLLALR